MKASTWIAAISLGGSALFCSTATAQAIPGQVAKGAPGWSCTTYKFTPEQQWACSQWSFLGNRELTPPPGFSEKVALSAKRSAQKPGKSRRKKRH